MPSTYKRKARPFRYNHVLPILIILEEKGKLNQSQIAGELDIKNQQGIVNAILAMQRQGWVELEYIQPKTTWVELTDKGRMLSKIAKELLDTIN